MSPLTAEVARRIVARTSSVVGRNVNVMDAQGLILASADADRVRRQHEGALMAVQRDSPVTIDAAEARMLRGAQPGVNMPLHHGGSVVGVIGISGDPDEVLVLADLIRVTAELILEQASMLESGQLLLQAREEFLLAALDRQVDEQTLRRRSAEVGIAIDVRRRCTLVQASDDGLDVLRVLQWSMGKRPDVLLARTRSDQLAVWWRADAPSVGEDLSAAVDAEPGRLTCASGLPFGGSDGLHRAWQSAADTLAVAHLSSDLYDQQDLPLVALLAALRDDPRASDIAAPWRALVAADRHGELRVTLRAWIASDLHPGHCAAALHVHRNTLRGRLHRIEQITGLPIGRVPSLLQLYLGPLLEADTAAR